MRFGDHTELSLLLPLVEGTGMHEVVSEGGGLSHILPVSVKWEMEAKAMRYPNLVSW